MNVPRKITIEAVLNGYIIKVGCQTVVFNDRNVMISELESYVANPQAMEKHYRENALNRAMLDDQTPIPKALADSIRQTHANQCETGEPPSAMQYNPVLKDPCCDREAPVTEPAPTEPCADTDPPPSPSFAADIAPLLRQRGPEPAPPPPHRPETMDIFAIGSEIATRRMQPRGPERAG